MRARHRASGELAKRFGHNAVFAAFSRTVTPVLRPAAVNRIGAKTGVQVQHRASGELAKKLGHNAVFVAFSRTVTPAAFRRIDERSDHSSELAKRTGCMRWQNQSIAVRCDTANDNHGCR